MISLSEAFVSLRNCIIGYSGPASLPHAPCGFLRINANDLPVYRLHLHRGYPFLALYLSNGYGFGLRVGSFLQEIPNRHTEVFSSALSQARFVPEMTLER